MRAKMISPLLLCVLLSAPVWGQERLHVSRLGRFHYWEGLRDLAVSGTYAYLTEMYSDFHVLDISVPGSPVEVGHYRSNSWAAYGVEAYGNYAYVSSTAGALYILDVTNPQEPELVSVLNGNSGSCLGLAYPYVYMGGARLSVVDVSNPQSPLVVGQCDLPTIPYGITLSGSYAYVADGIRGLIIFDVSDPSVPVAVGSFPAVEGWAVAVKIVGNLAYLLDAGGLGVIILDVSNPASPTELGHVGRYEGAGDLEISGSYVYVPNGERGLRVIDVSNPSAPVEVCLFFHERCSGWSIEIAGTVACVIGWGFETLDLTLPTSPRSLGYFNLSESAKRIAVHQGYAYIAKAEGVEINDVSDPIDPGTVGFYTAPSPPEDLVLIYPYIYLADDVGGLRIVNMTNHQYPDEVGHCAIPGEALSVAVAGSYAYVGCETGGLQIIDVSNPTLPQWVGTYPTTTITRLTVAGSCLYAGKMTGGILVLNISNPTSPTLLSTISYVDETRDLMVSDDKLYSGTYNHTSYDYYLRIYNVSTPSAPVALSTNDIPVEGLYVSGTLCYVVCTGSGLNVYNISNPASPIRVGYHSTSNVHDVMVVDSIAYLAEQHNFSVYDVSACNPPAVFSWTHSPAVPHIPANGGSFQYTETIAKLEPNPPVFNAWNMVELPNGNSYGPVAGPVSLTHPVGTRLTRTRTQWIPASAPTGWYKYWAFVGLYQFALWYWSSFSFYKEPVGEGDAIGDWFNTGDLFPGEEAVSSQPTAFSLDAARPNPFNASTALSFKLQATSHVSLKVYDTAGRQVTTLVDGWRQAGMHEVTFDGTKLASGIYLAKFSAGNFTAIQKLVLLK